MRRLSITAGIALSFALLTFTIQPVFAASMTTARLVPASPTNPNDNSTCHNTGHPVGQSATKGFSQTAFGVVTSGTLVIQLYYCDSNQSNFARVFFQADPGSRGSAPNITEHVDRIGRPNIPADFREAEHDIAPGGFQDSPILFAPNIPAEACAFLDEGGNCTFYY